MVADILIARHGENEDNANGILNGRRDLPLTELGRRQARELGAAIRTKGLMIDRIYCSPLVRALETAEIVRQAVGIRVATMVVPELVERDFGVMTGLPQTEIVPMCAPDIISADNVTYFLNPPGAETFPELLARGRQALEKVRAMQSSGTALLVCHGDVGKMIYAAASGLDWRQVLTDFHFGNGELLEIVPGNSAHVITLE